MIVRSYPQRTSAHNREKLTPPPPLSAKCPPWLNSPCLYGHTINFETSDVFFTKKCRRPHPKNPLPSVRKMSALDKQTSLPRDCGRPLWTAPYTRPDGTIGYIDFCFCCGRYGIQILSRSNSYTLPKTRHRSYLHVWAWCKAAEMGADTTHS